MDYALKLLETVGATGDGSTDDRAAINAALAMGRSWAGTPGAIYVIESALDPAHANASLDLQGATLFANFDAADRRATGGFLHLSQLRNGVFRARGSAVSTSDDQAGVTEGLRVLGKHGIIRDMQFVADIQQTHPNVLVGRPDEYPSPSRGFITVGTAVTDPNEEYDVEEEYGQVPVYNGDGEYTLLENLYFEKFNQPIWIHGDYCRVRNFTAELYRRGVTVSRFARIDVDGAYFGIVPPQFSSAPGCNALSGGPYGGTVINVHVVESLEHGFYFTRNADAKGRHLHISHVTIEYPGKTGIKQRGYDFSSTTDCIVYNAGMPSTPDIGDLGFRLENCGNFLFARNQMGREEGEVFNCGYAGLCIAGGHDIDVDDNICNRPSFAGLWITSGFLDLKHGYGEEGPDNIRVKNWVCRNGVGLRLDCEDSPMGNLHATGLKLSMRDIDADDPVVDIRLMAGTPWMAADKRIFLKGTYEVSGSTQYPNIPNDPQITWNELVPANEEDSGGAAATIHLYHRSSKRYRVTSSSASINTFGTGAKRGRRTLVADVAFTVNAAALALPTSQTIYAGEELDVECLGGTSWRFVGIRTKTGPRWLRCTTAQLTASYPAVNFPQSFIHVTDNTAGLELWHSDGTSWTPIGGQYLGRFTVANLPTGVPGGSTAFATNGRAIDGAGTIEGSGAGTGVGVQYNGSAWKITGTNVTVLA